jgi:hypothetical protein
METLVKDKVYDLNHDKLGGYRIEVEFVILPDFNCRACNACLEIFKQSVATRFTIDIFKYSTSKW